MGRSIQMAIFGVIMMGLFGCSRSTSAIEPISGFDLSRYLGTWYEIARYDHRFERGLSNVTANYSPKEDRVKVINQGYNDAKERWQTAEGKARFAGAKDIGYLEVSFFGPFYGDYKIMILDSEYRWSVVTSSSYDYLWILSRTPELSDTTLDELRQQLTTLGFPTDKLIYVVHDRTREK